MKRLVADDIKEAMDQMMKPRPASDLLVVHVDLWTTLGNMLAEQRREIEMGDIAERTAAVRFIRAVAKDLRPSRQDASVNPDVANELERVAKSIEAGLHKVMTGGG